MVVEDEVVTEDPECHLHERTLVVTFPPQLLSLLQMYLSSAVYLELFPHLRRRNSMNPWSVVAVWLVEQQSLLHSQRRTWNLLLLSESAHWHDLNPMGKD